MATQISSEVLEELNRFASQLGGSDDKQNRAAFDEIRDKYGFKEPPIAARGDGCGACGACAVCLGDGPIPDWEVAATTFLVKLD